MMPSLPWRAFAGNHLHQNLSIAELVFLFLFFFHIFFFVFFNDAFNSLNSISYLLMWEVPGNVVTRQVSFMNNEAFETVEARIVSAREYDSY